MVAVWLKCSGGGLYSVGSSDEGLCSGGGGLYSCHATTRILATIICFNHHLRGVVCNERDLPKHSFLRFLYQVMATSNQLLNRRSKKVQFITPKCNRHNSSFECGYYVMHWIKTIIRAEIVDDWIKAFNDASPMTKDGMLEIRKECSSYLLKKLQEA
ncbi:hypothetical protein DEO72_LG8g3012 [Vigna unguiculata]|uniref:Ulp1 protease family n=1 Tax=Vigna unguiculata TaxID=3917 RepID=A0A4D6MU08_VIGUN|nr:hypothetical protein DEO72_LG8g3012 [Vigna unguiculata]